MTTDLRDVPRNAAAEAGTGTPTHEALFGIEEEFMFLSRDALSPVATGESARRAMLDDPALARFVSHEFLASQIEYSSPILANAAQAARELSGFRSRLSEIASSLGVIAAGTGIPFDTTGRPAPTRGARYEHIRSEIRALVKDHQLNAAHVHVNVPSRETGVHALNGVRGWLPTLLALGANSPFWQGKDTGFASWRGLLARRWATTGCPPPFLDADDYAKRTARLVALGVATDRESISWNARLSERFPTLEVRVFDSQLDAESTVLLALLSRALVTTALDCAPSAPIDYEVLDAATWRAARDGLRGQLVDTVSGELVGADAAVWSLVHHVTPALEAHGDAPLVHELIPRLLHNGSGADLQRAAYKRGGMPTLAELLAGSLTSRRPG